MQRLLLAAALVAALFACRAAAAEEGRSDAKEVPQKTDPAAERIMVEAHRARSHWGADFPGFTASIAVWLDGTATHGRATVQSDGTVELDMPDGPAKKWAAEQLESIAFHRLAAAKDSYDVSFADAVTDHPLGRLIKFHDSSSHSLYRVKDDVITEVHRTMGKTRFTISVTSVTRDAQGKTLPSHFNVSYWDGPSGNLISNEDYQEKWTSLHGFDLPQRRVLIRTSNNQRSVAELQLSDLRLLPAK